jgi:YVTN family beta-propeller protein
MTRHDPVPSSAPTGFFVRPLAAALLACALAGCGSTPAPEAPDATSANPDAPPVIVPVLGRASKGGTIDLTSDDKTVVMVNPEAGSIAIFDATTQARRATLTTGGEPSAIVIHPDGVTGFVANRADATVVKVAGLDGATPAVAASVAVGAEPVGLALSPTGATLYVAELAESRVAVIDTATMAITATIAIDRPRAIAVTNDGDQDDADEQLIVASFWGEPIGTEATDASRQGRVHVYATGDRHEVASIVLAPIDSRFAPSTAAANAATVMASPNQLWAAGLAGGKLYLPSVSASAAGPLDFQANVQPVAYVVDLAALAEDRGALGSANLAALVRDQIPTGDPRLFLADTVDVAFIGDQIAYYLSRGGDAIQRVSYAGAAPTIGSSFNAQIELNKVPTGSTKACQTPTGIVTAHVGGFAYVNCWVTRQLGVIDLSSQALVKTVEAAAITTDEASAQRGRRFFFTGRGRWSKNAWSDCGSCHPDGYSDNITWSFNAGPRQTTALDGTFAHHPGDPQKQRVLNWTGIFDEIHDFERNTRGVSGGLGAITTAGAGGCGDLATEVRINIDDATRPGGLAEPVQAIIARTTGVCVHDWDDVAAWTKTVRPPRGRRFADPAAVLRGAAIFGEPTATASNAGCVKCHGGAGWTVSRVSFAPTASAIDDEHAATFTRPTAWPASWNNHGKRIEIEQAGTGRAPEQVACVLRNLATFGPAELEQRLVAGALVPAQGSQGYNVPSLYGMALGAPFLHHGLARDLPALFDDATWLAHAEAGSAVWLHTGTAGEIAARKADLITFLQAIDATTDEQAVPGPFDGCPVGP